jgi:sugar O-acyltransferase (sialic acid O-acetyltransferase NeuD family)
MFNSPVEKIVLVGVGGNFMDIYEDVLGAGIRVSGYTDFNEAKDMPVPYLGNDDDVVACPENVIITIGGIGEKISVREKVCNIYDGRNFSYVFQSALVSKTANISKASGVLILHNCLIKSHAEICKGVFINSGCIVAHHVKIGDYSQLSLGVIIGGNTTIGRRCFIGMGARIFQATKIGDNSIIAANSTVSRDVPPNSFVKGFNDIRPRRIP